ncbi:MAG: radical SAM family heme chaperone HemW [Bacteroidales bacterium]|nr:radical SAM family heme chaperone HemW [Bacteroidales bacterium]
MAGIYIHVPFCKKKCLYCDFYSIGTSNKISEFPLLIEKELLLRKDFIGDIPIDTIYLGGGTPSLLLPEAVSHVLNSISKTFCVSKNSEITIETNPDDLTKDLLLNYYDAGVNRISIGIQSFIDKELLFLGRRHSALAAEKSVELSLNAGFKNISIDLIYGLPDSTIINWEYNLRKAFSLDIKHLSCYHLTYENSTVLYRKLKENKIKEIDESVSVQQFNRLRELANQKGFIHYEVSNFAKESFNSRHNTSYWQGIHYLGLGPSAHSYNGIQREWNPNSYLEWELGIKLNKPATQFESIDTRTRFNELLLTHLRTTWGVDLDYLSKEFSNAMVEKLLINAKIYLKTSTLVIKNNHLLIPSEHFFISDGIIKDLLDVD